MLTRSSASRRQTPASEPGLFGRRRVSSVRIPMRGAYQRRAIIRGKSSAQLGEQHIDFVGAEDRVGPASDLTALHAPISQSEDEDLDFTVIEMTSLHDVPVRLGNRSSQAASQHPPALVLRLATCELATTIGARRVL